MKRMTPPPLPDFKAEDKIKQDNWMKNQMKDKMII